MKTVIRIFIICCLALLWGGSTGAIDKSKKADPSAKTSAVPAQTKTAEKPSPVKDTKVTPPEKPQKTYDDFIDRNNNGIDDRSEKGSAPKKSKTEKPPAGPVKKDPKR